MCVLPLEIDVRFFCGRLSTLMGHAKLDTKPVAVGNHQPPSRFFVLAEFPGVVGGDGVLYDRSFHAFHRVQSLELDCDHSR